MGRQDGLDLLDQRLLRDIRLGGRIDLVELADLVEEHLRGRQVEDRDRGAADRGRVPEADEAADPEPLLLAGARGMTETRSPTAKPFFDAVCSSIPTSCRLR